MDYSDGQGFGVRAIQGIIKTFIVGLKAVGF
jgi:hypothetical protein